MKKEKIYILVAKGHKRYKKQVNARTFEKNGELYGIVGNCKEGYSLTHIKTGMAITFELYYRKLLAEIPELIAKFEKLPAYYIEDGIKLFEEAEILKEV